MEKLNFVFTSDMSKRLPCVFLVSSCCPVFLNALERFHNEPACTSLPFNISRLQRQAGATEAALLQDSWLEAHLFIPFCYEILVKYQSRCHATSTTPPAENDYVSAGTGTISFLPVDDNDFFPL